MDMAALFVSLVSALGTGAAAIMAWVSRADALAAKESADQAQAAAVDAWERAAAALEEANAIQVRITEEAIDRERRAARTEAGEPVLRMYVGECTRASVGVRRTRESAAELRELTTRLTSTGEPGAFMILSLLDRLVRKVVPGDVASAVRSVQECFVLMREWMADPDGFVAQHVDDIPAEELIADTAEHVRSAQEAFAKMGRSATTE